MLKHLQDEVSIVSPANQAVCLFAGGRKMPLVVRLDSGIAECFMVTRCSQSSIRL